MKPIGQAFEPAPSKIYSPEAIVPPPPKFSVQALQAFWQRNIENGPSVEEELIEAKQELREMQLAADRQAPAEPINRETLETSAIAWLITIGPNAAEIARKVGKPRTTLMGWSRFRLAYQKAKEDAADNKAEMPRGSKDKTGAMEAWSRD